MLNTIGYEGAKPSDFLQTLRSAEVGTHSRRDDQWLTFVYPSVHLRRAGHYWASTHRIEFYLRSC
ncbi:MAG: hypothetical protein JWM33_2331 [Caulobacteraceae bacterium]|nr:hypothetical protein [Caulobacteraceae bacterium]